MSATDARYLTTIAAQRHSTPETALDVLTERAIHAAAHALQVGYHGHQPLSDSEPIDTERSAKDYPIHFSRCCE